MKIKLNWGTGVVGIIIGMLLFMGILVFIAVRQDYYLVEDDYYEKSMVYQDQIDKIKNTNALKEKIIVVEERGFLEIVFPVEFDESTIEGTIYLYSPINKSNDYKTEIKLFENLTQTINTVNLKKGRYKLKIDWNSKNKYYYQESNINVR